MGSVVQLALSKATSRRAPSFLRLSEEKMRSGWETTNISCQSRSAIPASEQGYILLAAIFFLALLVISLAVAAPRIARAIQRDREVETFHRGMQYRRAVQLYYRKFHAYPPNADALVKTNEIRFLRKKYIDPVTGKDDWKPVLYGQNKTPTAMGFFGQPLSGNASTIAGVGPTGGNGLNGISPTGAMSMSGGGYLPGSNNDIFSSSNSSTSVTGTTGSTTSTTGATTSTTGTSGSDSGSTGDNGGASGSTGGTGTVSSGTSSSGSNGSGTGSGQTGQTFGGAGIIGFSPASPKQSILVYKKKNHYNEWEFTYDPLSDMQTMSGGNTGTVGQPASSTSSPVGSSSFGSPTSGSTSSPSSPSSTTSPQQ
jgi:type II secretory pathway pseudopilin PulG